MEIKLFGEDAKQIKDNVKFVHFYVDIDYIEGRKVVTLTLDDSEDWQLDFGGM